MKSRRYTIVDVAEPRDLTTKFVYNFFVSDERINDSGETAVKGIKNDTLQKLIDSDSLRFEVPRYVEVSFSQVNTFGNDFGDAKNQSYLNSFDSSKISSEETITNIGFAALRESDESSLPRLKEKFDALSKVMGLNFEDPDQSKNLSNAMNIPQEDVQSVLSPLSNDRFVVNAKKDATPVSPFQKSTEARVISQINKRLLGAACNSADDASPLSRVETVNVADKIVKEFFSVAQQFSFADEDIEPILQPINMQKTSEKPRLLGISAIGYLLTRRRIGDDGRNQQIKTFFLPGSENTKYLDSEIVYGASYSYDVRAVYRIDAIVEGKNQAVKLSEKSRQRIEFLLASRPSPTSRVKTEEFEPPIEPDAVFYNFNYEKDRGLVVKWQVPSGKSRDVKYFQVFRRKNIYEPFSCIAQLDFDDSVIRTLLPEQVKQERVYSFSGIRTFHEDKDFTRDSKFIYAVCAIDAHGLSSGYSVQTEVSFSKIKNSLLLKSISRSGAPKQYPNFYVDPRMDDNIAVDSFSQDAIFDSGHSKMSVYFTPDARIIRSADKNVENVFCTNSQNGAYSFHFINLDLQKSDTITIGIDDLRKQK